MAALGDQSLKNRSLYWIECRFAADFLLVRVDYSGISYALLSTINL